MSPCHKRNETISLSGKRLGDVVLSRCPVSPSSRVGRPERSGEEWSGLSTEIDHLAVEPPRAGISVGQAGERAHEPAHRSLRDCLLVNKHDAAVTPIPGEPLARECLEIDDVVGNDGAGLCSGELKHLRIEEAHTIPFMDRGGVVSLAPELDRDARIDVFVQEESGHTYHRSGVRAAQAERQVGRSRQAWDDKANCGKGRRGTKHGLS